MTKKFSKINRTHFNTIEILVLFSSISSSVASIIFQQVAFAAVTSIPLSLAISLSSHHRRQLDDVIQKHQAKASQLEQQFSNNQDIVDKIFASLPNRSELADTENRIEARNTALSEQLDKLKKQLNTHLESQQSNNCQSKVTDVQQRLITVEKILQSYDLEQPYIKSQETLISLEARITKLEQQFNNFSIFDLQNQVARVEKSVNNLEVNSTESIQLYKYFLTEIEYTSQQVQVLNNETETLSTAYAEIKKQQLFIDSQVTINKYIELNQQLAKEVEALHQQIQAVSSNVSERIKSLRVELQTHILTVKKSEHKIHIDLYELTDWLNRLENELKQREYSKLTTSSKQTKQVISNITSKEVRHECKYCPNYTTQPIKGGEFLNYYFCSPNCKLEYERMNGLLQ